MAHPSLYSVRDGVNVAALSSTTKGRQVVGGGCAFGNANEWEVSDRNPPVCLRQSPDQEAETIDSSLWNYNMHRDNYSWVQMSHEKFYPGPRWTSGVTAVDPRSLYQGDFGVNPSVYQKIDYFKN